MKKTTSRRNGTPPKRSRESIPAAPMSESADFPIVGVGASAGGLEAFTELFRHVPPDAGMAFVLIQHLDPTHPSYLREALARSTKLPVHEARDRMRVEPGHVYVIPSSADIGILNGELTLRSRTPDQHRPHLPIDFFFKALADDVGDRAMAVVLSGTGSDGAEGLRAIKAGGGVAFAQYPKSAKYPGMPEAAVQTGAVDVCLALPELAREVVRVGRQPFLRGREAERPPTPHDDAQFKRVLLLIRSAVGIDFSEHKPASIRRRLARRMALRHLSTLEEYVRLLQEDPTEVQALGADILIHVTSFFRDPEAFESLKVQAFPEILKRKREGGTIRIWSAGCSTGEEPYSLLIALLEFLDEQDASDVPVQLFGTDLSEKAIEKARAGVYPEAALRDVSPERMARFFIPVDGGGYRITKSIRDRCAFVKHDLAADPPFSKLDLVCCRNVLIYFGPELQRRVLAAFHFALNQPGFLMLGSAESAADAASLFRATAKESKVFVRAPVRSTLMLGPPRASRAAQPALAEPRPSLSDVVRRTEGLLLERYAPPGVVINGRMEILHFVGRTGPYLEAAPGQPRHDLMKMARQGLVGDLRIAISQARKGKTPVRVSGVHVEQGGSARPCDVVVIPVALPPESQEEVFAVVFETPAAAAVSPGRPPSPSGPVADPRRAGQLENELRATHDYLHSVVEEHQRANEEYLSANEELVSSNEELQSLNEELQTAKEELQSTNEELSTLNEELHSRNAELNSANGDLINILGSVEVPIVIVDGNRRIRRFTPKARPILNLLPSDVGRPIDDIRPYLMTESLDRKIADVIDTVVSCEEEVQGRDGRWYRLQIRPYMTVDRRIDGAVLSVVDIDVLKRALEAAEWARDYAQATVEAVQVPLVVLNERVEVISANRAFKERYGLAQEVVTGHSIRDFIDGAVDAAPLQAALEGVRTRGESFQGLETECELPRVGRRALSLSARPVTTLERGLLILLAVEDVSDRLRAEAERASLLSDTEKAKASAEAANRTKVLFIATLSHELRTPLSSLLLCGQLLGRGSLDEAKVRKIGATIERGARAQAQLIDDLLDVSRIMTGKLKMELQSVSLASVVQAAADTIAPIAERKQIEFEVRLNDTLPLVSGDPLRLQQVVSNLLTNAVKFTPEKGRITVTVDDAEGRARLRVTDTGVGINADFLPYIFGQFAQEDRGETRTYGGLGLGLSIVRYLVEAHGGTVCADSAGKDQGATFTVLLPQMRTREAGLRAEEQGPDLADLGTDIKGVRVLVVEDDPATREAVTEMLGMIGAEVQAAESASKALGMFAAFRPAVLVCDIAMPEENGYSLLRRVRALGPEQGGDVPALALTALGSDEDRRRAREAGFQKHAAKPIDVERLAAAVTSLLRPDALSPRKPAELQP